MSGFWTSDTCSTIGDFWKKKFVSSLLFVVFLASSTHRPKPEHRDLDRIESFFGVLWKSVSSRFEEKICIDRLKVLESQMVVERSVICFIPVLERELIVPVLTPERIL